jgi:hypothetical protein
MAKKAEKVTCEICGNFTGRAIASGINKLVFAREKSAKKSS